MKCYLYLLAALLPLLASAASLKISAKVLDRATDGSAIRGQYVYPSVELESGEPGRLHIGREIRYPVWTEAVAVGDGVSKEETRYEESRIGLELSIRYEMKQGQVTYLGKAKSTVTRGTVDGLTLTESVDAVFHGKSRIGDVIETRYAGPDGTEEEIFLFFGPSDE
ncbi:MAG: hypothetical protein ACLFU4_05535 [Opitutales bacterium]